MSEADKRLVEKIKRRWKKPSLLFGELDFKAKWICEVAMYDTLSLIDLIRKLKGESK